MNIYINLFILLFLLSMFSFFSLAPFVPTRKSDFLRINRIISLRENEKFLEIGCGIASLSIFIAKNNPLNEIYGIELSPLFYIISKIRVFLSGEKNIKIIYGNAMNLNFSNYDVFYIFGLPETIKNLILPKLEKEMHKSSRFYSYCFRMENNKFYELKYKENEKLISIYEYKIND